MLFGVKQMLRNFKMEESLLLDTRTCIEPTRRNVTSQAIAFHLTHEL